MNQKRSYVLFAVVLSGLLLALAGSFNNGSDEFIHLSRSFRSGVTYFINPLLNADYDMVSYQGRLYWPQGPFPAVVLLPIVTLADLLHQPVTQGIIQFAFTIVTVFGVYKLVRRLKISRLDATTWTVAFVMGSMYIGQVFASSYAFAHVMVVALMVGALLEFTGRRRWWMIGLFYGAILLTRPTAAVTILFFVLQAFTELKGQIRFRALWHLALPLGVAVVAALSYNFIRFGNPLESGYALQILYSPALRIARDQFGLFSLAHVPGNLYRMFIAGPLPVTYANTMVVRPPYIAIDLQGMGMLLTSPYLIGLFFLDLRDKLARHLLLAVILTALPILFYYGVGWMQFGYRYALDFWPMLFYLFAWTYHRQQRSIQSGLFWLVMVSAMINTYLLITQI